MYPPSLHRIPTVPLPPLVTGGPCNVHRLLAKSSPPSLTWDIRYPPTHETFSRSLQGEGWNEPWTCEPATYPPLQSVTIRIEDCGSVIIAFPNPSITGKPFVTVMDVLDRVFRAGQEPECGLGGPVGVDLAIESHFDQTQDLGAVTPASRGCLPTVGLFAPHLRNLIASADHRTGTPKIIRRWSVIGSTPTDGWRP
ncbi:hypothetical protein EST38_g2613 [Candolleomyces aberdarensis]|uniref:DUF6699 domain-containing protein n=1 Tax=Candolleomyces aberdarensis TaxID=2316362 RepID=A0A4Q2DT36_9AGAR|nr:hypothetical protein EST38_g2613 [Candolleomyces aberdarensis]